MTRCDFFDSTLGCRLEVVDGIPSSETCGACARYVGPPRGLGDRVYRLTQATGIDQVVRRLAPDGCGCEERRRRLNSAFPSSRTS